MMGGGSGGDVILSGYKDRSPHRFLKIVHVPGCVDIGEIMTVFHTPICAWSWGLYLSSIVGESYRCHLQM